MPRKTRTSSLSLAAECAIPKIETDIRRRLFLAGMAGAACAFSSRPLSVQAASPNRTTTSPDGIIRETLESYVNEAGKDFRLVLTTYPPGVGAPSHHHPSVGLNYVLEGVAGRNTSAKNCAGLHPDRVTRTRPASNTRSSAIRIRRRRSNIC
jgi:hypothetical protein